MFIQSSSFLFVSLGKLIRLRDSLDTLEKFICLLDKFICERKLRQTNEYVIIYSFVFVVSQVHRNEEHTTLTVDGVSQARTSRGKEFHFGKFATNSDVFVGGMPNW